MNITKANWYECRFCYNKETETGTIKKMNETYVVDALSFAEAEQKILDEAIALMDCFNIKSIAEAKFSEIIHDGLPGDPEWQWYKAKVNIIALDERSGKEKKTPILFLVNSPSVECVTSHIRDIMTMQDYEIASVTDTNITEVLT